MSRVDHPNCRLPHSNEGLYHARRQMPVGQGGFHVGLLAKERTLRTPWHDLSSLFVYDCGSIRKDPLQREIEGLLKVFEGKRLDVVILSHFDADHISGIPRLLDPTRGFKVDTIMLPFVDMDQRMIALARAATRRGEVDDFLIKMVTDPIEALAEFEPQRIILVGASGDDQVGGGPLDRMPDVDRPGGEREAGEEIIEWFLGHAKPDRPARQRREPRRLGKSGAEVLVVQDVDLRAAVRGHPPFWMLRPYVRRADPGRISDFRFEVEKRFKWPEGSFKERVADNNVRQMLITSGRPDMSRAYEAAFKNKNLTSLCLYSGPFDPAGMDASSYGRLASHRLTKVGWLGTGDTDLRKRANIAGFREEYKDTLDLVSTFVFPHHGSIKNSDPANLVCDADAWIAAAEPVHRWKNTHPHPKLKQAAKKVGAVFKRVGSIPTQGYMEWFRLWPRRSP